MTRQSQPYVFKEQNEGQSGYIVRGGRTITDRMIGTTGIKSCRI
jgi:hypothetical protein